MIRTIKKSLTIVSVSAIAICVALLIGAVFGLSVFEGIIFKVLLTFGVIAIASAIAINAVDLLSRTYVVSLVCLSLLAILSVLSIIIFWTGFDKSVVFGNITATLALATIFFIIIVNFNSKIANRYKLLQILTYIAIVIIDIILTLTIWGVGILVINGVWQAFAVVCLGAFALLCTLGVLSKRVIGTNEVENSAMVKIPKAEYESLLKKINILEQENAELKKITVKKNKKQDLKN